ncbi:MAG: YfhL family 4Fe-4S dicluster ferredoxin [Chloroflexota bacterium]|nr:YfhL family 4Fe-4S dicluster ferredoxin [Chloroflexota bacterium]
MSYKITPDCISCGACEPECPNQAIAEGESIYIVDPTKCTECVGSYVSSRCAEVCPIDDCCVPDPEHKETKQVHLARWRKSHAGEEPAPGTF